MIRINCTHCKAQLSIDDAFAGGVCRCQYCGTIQTVPKHLKADSGASSGVVSNAASSTTPKALYQNKARAGEGMPSSGLDEIASAIATSSGLSRSALTTGGGNPRRGSGGDLQPPEGGAAPARNRTLQVLTITAVAIVLMLGVIIGVLLSNRSGGTPVPSNSTTPQATGAGSTPAPTATVTTTPNPTPGVATGPSFLGQPLTEPTVVFMLDHGQANVDSFEYVKQVVAKSLRSFRPDQKFQVVFWKGDTEKDSVVAPAKLSNVNAESLKAVDGDFEKVYAWGSTNAKLSLTKAFAAKPAALVIVSAKPVGDDFSKLVMDARGQLPTKVHCFAINAPPSARQMTDVAKRTGGSYHEVSIEQLKSLR